MQAIFGAFCFPGLLSHPVGGWPGGTGVNGCSFVSVQEAWQTDLVAAWVKLWMHAVVCVYRNLWSGLRNKFSFCTFLLRHLPTYPAILKRPCLPFPVCFSGSAVYFRLLSVWVFGCIPPYERECIRLAPYPRFADFYFQVVLGYLFPYHKHDYTISRGDIILEHTASSSIQQLPTITQGYTLHRQ